MPEPSRPLITTSADTPLATFTRCHLGIVHQLEETALLPGWIEAAARARQTAAATLELFRKAIIPHHREEEAELFPAVLQSARPGEERQKVERLVQMLTDEHAHIESLWKKLEPAVRAASRGAEAGMDAEVLSDLVHMYLRHARFEESEFLPLSEEILGRNGNHMAALGVSIHLRHARQPVGYI
jgi:hemerythrin-like domain-containing protein